MNLEIKSQSRNLLLDRLEIVFEVKHEKMGTPKRFDVRKKIADVLNKNIDSVYVRRLESKTGTMVAVGNANVYDSLDAVKMLEPKHILDRNAPIEKTEVEEEK